MTDQSNNVYLLSILGTLAPQTLEAARNTHNQTAGAPAGVAAARALGDLSHMVYVPIPHDGHPDGQFLILDQWNNLEGLNQFFADPQVQQGGHMIFTQRDPVVWAPAQEFTSYHFPAPTGRNERYVGIVRGMVNSRAEAAEVHNALLGKLVNKARMAGNLSHEAFFRLAAPGSPEALEFFAVDVWFDGEGMGRHYDDPDLMSGLMAMFAAEPMAAAFMHPGGDWVEW